METPTQRSGGLASEAWAERERIVRQFDQAWRRGLRPTIDGLLPPPGPGRTPVLVELVHTELEYRLKDGEAARVEEYLARYPELGPEAEAELIAAEWELRRRREPGLTRDEYHARFPGRRGEWLGSRGPRTHAEGEPAEPPGGRTRLGKYELFEEVGRGAFGVVYRAHDTVLDRVVAVKVPRRGVGGGGDDNGHANGDGKREGERDRFFREARSAAQLDHPAIVSVHDVGRDGETSYIVCEFVPGTTLSARMAAGRLGIDEAVGLVAVVAEALDYAHRMGVVHRDVKPSNILIDGDGRPHVSDFGLARRESGESTITAEGDLLGTPAYMSPEQARGAAHRVDARSDLYSLGVVLYELLTGELPFRGSPRVLLKQVLESDPPPPRRWNDRVPRDAEVVCLKCLEKDPSRRYPDAAALAADLRRFLAREPIRARPVGAAGRAWRWCRRRPLVAGLIAALVVAIVAGFAGVTWQWLRARRGWAEADENFRTARATVDDYLMVVQKDAMLRRNLPGLMKFRGELLGKALAYYQEFLRKHGDDRSLQAMTASAYENIGLVYKSTGEPAAAEAAFRKALAAREALARADPGATRRRAELAATFINLASLEHVTGRPAEAERNYLRAATILDALAAAEPGDPRHRFNLALIEQARGDLRSGGDRPADAGRNYERARDLLIALVAAHPADTEYRNALARAHSGLGNLQRDTGAPDRAEQSYRAALDILRALLDAQPYAADYLNSYGGISANLGLLRQLNGRPAEAEQSYREAIDALQKLVAAEPYVTGFQSVLAGRHVNLGNLQSETGRPADAGRSYAEALRILRKVVAAEPRNSEHRNALAEACLNLGNLQGATGRPTDAEANYAEARDLWTVLAREHPDSLLYQDRRAVALNNLGDVLCLSGRPAEAVAFARQAVDLQRGVTARAPQVTEYREHLGAFYTGLAQAQRLGNRPADAAATAEERAALRPVDPSEQFEAARQLALCVPLAPPGDRPAYVGRALALLRRAVAAGFTRADVLSRDPDFDALRPDPRFQALVSDLAFPADPFSTPR